MTIIDIFVLLLSKNICIKN